MENDAKGINENNDKENVVNKINPTTHDPLSDGNTNFNIKSSKDLNETPITQNEISNYLLKLIKKI